MADDRDEFLMAWIEGDDSQFSVKPIFEDPGMFGIIFADMVRVLEEAYRDEGYAGTEPVIDRVRAAFLAELEAPTS